MKSHFPVTELGKHIAQVSTRNRSGAEIEVFSVTNSEGFTRSTEYFSKEVFSKDVSNYKVVKPGQFAYNPSRINVGSIDYLRHQSSVLVSPLYIVFEGTQETHADYLLRYLKSDWGNAQIRSNTEGAVRDSLKYKSLEKIKLPLPPVNDQIRIADLLGKVEGLISKRKKQLQQLDDLLKSVFLKMFGDPERNEKGWNKLDFKTIMSGMRNGLSPSKTGTNKGSVYTLSAITGDSFQEISKEDIFSQIHEKYFPSESDFLICRGNGNIRLVGKGCFFPGKSQQVIFPDTIIAVSIQPNIVNKHFFEALWKTRFIRQQIENSARTTNGAYKINQSVIEKIKIIQPPVVLQNQFAAIVEKIQSLKSLYQQSLSNLESLYGAFSQQAFKGELDLSRVPLPAEYTKQKIDEIESSKNVEFKISLSDFFRVPEVAANIDVKKPEGRNVFLMSMLSAWLEQFSHKTFSLGDFMDNIQNKLWELTDGESNLNADDYDQIKNWVFEALRKGRILQDRNITHCVIETKEMVFGNLIELKAGV